MQKQENRKVGESTNAVYSLTLLRVCGTLMRGANEISMQPHCGALLWSDQIKCIISKDFS